MIGIRMLKNGLAILEKAEIRKIIKMYFNKYNDNNILSKKGV